MLRKPRSHSLWRGISWFWSLQCSAALSAQWCSRGTRATHDSTRDQNWILPHAGHVPLTFQFFFWCWSKLFRANNRQKAGAPVLHKEIMLYYSVETQLLKKTKLCPFICFDLEATTIWSSLFLSLLCAQGFLLQGPRATIRCAGDQTWIGHE